jgi:diguanylate cyclase (GGDEF)-like protein
MWRLGKQSRKAGEPGEQPSEHDVAALEGQCKALAEVADGLVRRLGRLLENEPGENDDGSLHGDLEAFTGRIRDRSIAELSERKREKQFVFIDDAVQQRLEYLSDLHDEFRRVIALLSESLVALSTANVDYHAELREKLDHLVQASRLDDLRSLKSTITREIESTRELVRRKRRSEEQSIDALASEVSTLNAELSRAREESKRDELTGIGNRRALNAYLDELVEAQGPSGSIGSVLIADIDDFKSINDRYGHAVGDRALLGVSGIMTGEIRADDLLARLGGDEFVVVLPKASLRNARRVAEDIRSAIEATHFTLEESGDHGLAMTVSIGVAQHASGETVSELMQRADQGLYDAKSRGKNLVGGAD